MERPAPTRADVHDCSRFPPIPSAQAGQRGRGRISGPPPQPSLPAIRQAILDHLTGPPDKPCPHCGRRLSDPLGNMLLLVVINVS